MRMKFMALVLGIIVLISANLSFAGLRITLTDGTSIRGELVRRTSKEMIIRTGGVLRTLDIKNVKTVDYEHMSSDSFNDMFGTDPSSELSAESTKLLLQARGYLPQSATAEVQSKAGVDPRASIVRPEDFTAELRSLNSRPKGYYSFYEGHDKERPAQTVKNLEPKQLVYLKSGRVLKGIVIRESDKNLVLQLDSGTISIYKSDVDVIETETVKPEPEAEEVSDAT